MELGPLNTTGGTETPDMENELLPVLPAEGVDIQDIGKELEEELARVLPDIEKQAA